MRTIAKTLLVIVALFAFTALSIYAYLSSLNAGDFRDDIAQLVKQSTGRDLAIKGDVSLKIFPAPKLVVEGVSLSNAKWGVRPTLISVDRVVAELAILPLFSRTISIERIVLVRPVLHLERNASGESNWNLRQNVSTSFGSGAPLIDVTNVDVRSGRISYLIHGAGRPTVLKVQQMRLRSKGFLKPMDVWFTGRFNDHAFRVRGETGSLATLLNNEPLAVDLRMNSGGVVATIKGGLRRPLEFRGVGASLTLTSGDLGQLLNLRRDHARERVALTGHGRIRDKKGRYVLDQLELSIGMSDLTGSITFGTVRGRGLVKAALGSKLMDLDSIFQTADERKRRPKARLIPGWTLPAEFLRSIDADVHFSGRRVVLGGVDFDRLRVNLGVDSGRMQIKPRGKLYGGDFDGRISLDASVGTPKLLMEIRGNKVRMGSLLSALKGKQVMAGGTGQLYLKLEGAGHSPRAIAASMNGRFLTSMGPGRINNSDIKRVGADALMQLVRAFDPADKSDRVTNMRCGVIRFDVKKGIAETDRGIAAETEKINIIGSGTINLGTEAIDLALRAQPRDGVGLSATSLGNVVRVGGTLAAPAPQMDAVGALKTGVSVGAAVATSGISLLVQGIFNRLTADSAPCKTALNVKRSQRKVAPRQSSRDGSRAGSQ